MSVVGTVLSTVAGNPCPVLSQAAWRRCDSHPVGHSAVLRRRAADVAGVVERVGWMRHPIREIGQGGGDGVDAEPASSEAENRYLVQGLSGGASGEAENRYLVRGLGRGGELVPRPRPCGVGLGRIGESTEASWLSLSFDIYKV